MGGGEVDFRSVDPIEFGPDIRAELGAFIGGNQVRDAVAGDPFIIE